MEDWAFHLCKSLKSMEIPDGVTCIGANAFQFCSGFQSVVIPESVTEIGDKAFDQCTALASAAVPQRFSNRYAAIFDKDPWLNGTLGDFAVVDGVLTRYLGAEGRVVMPEGVTKIAADAFKVTPQIDALKLPESLREIDGKAFGDSNIGRQNYSDGKLVGRVDIYIPAGVERIGEMAFTFGINAWFCGDKPAVTPVSFGAEMMYVPSRAAGWEEFKKYCPTWDPAYAVSTTILVDGQPVDFDAYSLKGINGNDTIYLKLRDMADALDVAAAQFDVSWDGAITLTSGAPYAGRDGTEGRRPFAGNHAYTPMAGTVRVDGTEQAMDAITLTDNQGNGYTYFKLRDLGAALGFSVKWEEAGGTIRVDT